MDFKSTVIWMFVLVFPVAKIDAAFNKQIYKMNTDQTKIDEITRSFVFYKESALGKVEKLKLKLPILKHVCKINRDLKAALCERVLQIDYLGFTFDMSRPSDFDCLEKYLYLRFTTMRTLEYTKLLMYSCPPLYYIDLETGERTAAPYAYEISIAKKLNSALLLVRKTLRGNTIMTYTQGILERISFGALKSYAKHRTESLSNRVPLRSNREDIIRDYARAKQTKSTYEKFVKFYSSVNVCGRRRSHNVYICRKTITKAFEMNENTKFDLVGYDEGGCNRHNVSLVSTEWDKKAGKFDEPQVELSMFRCPAVEMEYLRHDSKIFLLVYVVSNLSAHSVTLFIRDNSMRRELPVPYVNIYNLNMQPIIEDIRRQRFLPQPIEDEFTFYESPPRSPSRPASPARAEVRSPSTLVAIYRVKKTKKLPKIEGSVSVNYDRWLTEKILISFSEVKNMKLAYQRFATTYESIDFCQLSVKQKVAFCEDTFKKYYGDGSRTIIYDASLRSRCQRNTVTLTTRDAVHLVSKVYTMWKCPGLTDEEEEQAYFIGKNHLKDSAVAYKVVRIDGADYYYPYILIGEVNRHMLAQAMIKGIIF